MMTPEQINMTSANSVGILFAPGDATIVQTKTTGPDGNAVGGNRPQAGPADGLGSAGSLVSWRAGAHWLWLLSIGAALAW
jgi:hypothetical protein